MIAADRQDHVRGCSGTARRPSFGEELQFHLAEEFGERRADGLPEARPDGGPSRPRQPDDAP